MTATVCFTAKNIYYLKGGGHFWVPLNWALGLRALGCDVIWLEPIDPSTPVEEVWTLTTLLKDRLEPYGLRDSVALSSITGEPIDPAAAEGCLDNSGWSTSRPATVRQITTGRMRESDNLFCASMMALKAKTGAYVWYFQQVHHDIWNYDAANPVVLSDMAINGQPRRGIAEVGHTGWLYILDRTNGQPLIGIEERPVPQEPWQKTAKTHPYPIGDATVPQCADKLPDYDKAGCIFEPFWETPVQVQPSGDGGTGWSPVPYSPDTGYFYVSGTVRASVNWRKNKEYVPGKSYGGGAEAP